MTVVSAGVVHGLCGVDAGGLGGGVGAHDVLDIVCVGVEESECRGSQPYPLVVLGPEPVHQGHHLPLHLDHLVKVLFHVGLVLAMDEFVTRFS